MAVLRGVLHDDFPPAARAGGPLWGAAELTVP